MQSKSGKPRIGVIGAGLIGGSIAIAASRKKYPTIVFDPNQDLRERVIHDHALGWAHNLKALVDRADIIVIATPSDKVAEVVAAIVGDLRPGQTLMDVSSTKLSPTIALAAAPAGVTVIGSHPMAGTTPGGFQNASPTLFEDCVWVLCPLDGETVPSPVSRLINDLGTAQTIVCSAEEHDRAVASVSHGVQVGATSIAAAVNAVVARERLPWMLAANGWRDTTRIADANPDMWTPVLLDNAPNVIPVVAEMITHLEKMKAALEAGDADAVRDLLNAGTQARQEWEEFSI